MAILNFVQLIVLAFIFQGVQSSRLAGHRGNLSLDLVAPTRSTPTPNTVCPPSLYPPVTKSVYEVIYEIETSVNSAVSKSKTEFVPIYETCTLTEYYFTTYVFVIEGGSESWIPQEVSTLLGTWESLSGIPITTIHHPSSILHISAGNDMSGEGSSGEYSATTTTPTTTVGSSTAVSSSSISAQPSNTSGYKIVQANECIDPVAHLAGKDLVWVAYLNFTLYGWFYGIVDTSGTVTVTDGVFGDGDGEIYVVDLTDLPNSVTVIMTDLYTIGSFVTFTPGSPVIVEVSQCSGKASKRSTKEIRTHHMVEKRQNPDLKQFTVDVVDTCNNSVSGLSLSALCSEQSTFLNKGFPPNIVFNQSTVNLRSVGSGAYLGTCPIESLEEVQLECLGAQKSFYDICTPSQGIVAGILGEVCPLLTSQIGGLAGMACRALKFIGEDCPIVDNLIANGAAGQVEACHGKGVGNYLSIKLYGLPGSASYVQLSTQDIGNPAPISTVIQVSATVGCSNATISAATPATTSFAN